MNKKKLYCLGVLLILTCPQHGFCQIGVDAYAREIAERVSKTYAQIPQLSVDCTAVLRQPNANGNVVLNETRHRLVFRRPDGLAYRFLDGSAPIPEIFYLKGTARMRLPGMGIVSRRVRTLTRLFRSTSFGYDRETETNQLLDQNFAVAIVRELLLPQPDEAWDKDVVGYEFVGREEANGTQNIGISLKMKHKDRSSELHLWVTDEDIPKLVRFEIARQDLNKRGAAFYGSFSNLDFSPKLTDDSFQPKEGQAPLLRSIMEARRTAAAAHQKDFQIRERYKGTEIDNLQLKLVDGSEISLAEFAKNKTVVIDFWATWSSHCVDAIPNWISVLNDDAYQDVAYIAVNQGQTAHVVTDFVKDKGWNGNFVVDPKREIGEQLSVYALPHTVVVGIDGQIADVLFDVKNAAAIRDVLDSVIHAKTALASETINEIQSRQQKVQSVIAKNSSAVVGLLVGRGGGSGVIVSPDGLILTAAHVTMEAGKEVLVFLEDGTRVKAKSLGANHQRDAALIQIEEEGEWPYVEMAETTPDLGSWVVVMGHPGGFSNNRSAPVRIGRVIKSPDRRGRGQGFLGTDCTITQGDSGGPAFDLDGRVVGIHSFISARLEDNLHVPITAFKTDWERLKKGEVWGRNNNGRNRRPDTEEPQPDPNRPILGVGLEDLEGGGVKVILVQSDSPAAKAGLKVGDIIKKIAGLNDVTDIQAYRAEMRAHKAGDKIKVVVERENETVELEVTLGKRP